MQTYRNAFINISIVLNLVHYGRLLAMGGTPKHPDCKNRGLERRAAEAAMAYLV
jgi:hypothetical protein